TRDSVPSTWGKHSRTLDKQTSSSPSPMPLPPLSSGLLSPLYSKTLSPHNCSINFREACGKVLAGKHFSTMAFRGGEGGFPDRLRGFCSWSVARIPHVHSATETATASRPWPAPFTRRHRPFAPLPFPCDSCLFGRIRDHDVM